MLVVVNLDPHRPESGTLDLDIGALGLDPVRSYTVEDLLGGRTFTWRGSRPWVELDPAHHPAHVLRVSQAPADDRPSPDGPV